MTLSGGMKRRVMIAKALSHEPRDSVPRRADGGRRRGTAPRHVGAGASAARFRHRPSSSPRTISKRRKRWPTAIGVIVKGELILVEDKRTLMRKLGKKRLTFTLDSPLAAIPAAFGGAPADARRPTGRSSSIPMARTARMTGIAALLRDLVAAGVIGKGSPTRDESSLEDIFVSLIRRAP